MKPRFSQCTGKTPTFLRDLESGPEKYSLVFAIGGEDKEVYFLDEAAFLEALAFVLNSKVPVSGGRMNLGASGKIGHLSLEGKVTNKYVSISWSGGGNWEVREPGDKSRMWEPCDDPYEIANKAFNLDALKRAH